GSANNMRSTTIKTRLFIVENLIAESIGDARRHLHFGELAVSVRQFNLAATLADRPASGLVGELFSALTLNHDPASRARGEQALREMVDSPFAARVNLELGNNEYQRNNPAKALEYYHKAQSGNDLSAFLSEVMAAQAIGVEGDHCQALELLEALERKAFCVGQFYLPYLYQWMNALAVELGEVGKIERALKLARLACASPYVTAYPEWQETLAELEGKMPS